MKPAGIAIPVILIAFLGNYSADKRSPRTQPELVSMTIAEYRDYLETHPPLDRLYIRDGRAYFLTGHANIPNSAPTAAASHPQQINGGRNGPFHSYIETGDVLQELAEQYPHLARFRSIGRSTNGREIWLLQISDHVEAEEGEPNLYILGCHHAREWISVEVPLRFARHLLENYERDPQIRALLDRTQVYIVPIVNPDGLEFSIEQYRFWRKSRRFLGGTTWGIDLNRNYGFKWGIDNQGSSPYPESEVYRGSAPFSEPETAAVRDFMLQHAPAAAITYHNYSQVILYPWGYTTTPSPDEPLFKAVAAEMAERIFTVRGSRYEYGSGASLLYKTNGDFDDWVYGTFSVPSFTIELPPPSVLYGGFYTPGAEIEPIFQENLPALLYFLAFFSTRPPATH